MSSPGPPPRGFATATAAIADAQAINACYLAEIGFAELIGRNVDAVVSNRTIISFVCLLMQETLLPLLYWQYSD